VKATEIGSLAVVLPYNLAMMNIPRLLGRPLAGCRLGSNLVLGLVIIATGIPGPGSGGGTAAAQSSGPCALLMTDEIEPLASNATIADGVSKSLETVGLSTCRYTWGEGVGRFKLDVTVNEASRMFAGKGPDLIKQGLSESVTAGTADAVIPDIGEAAVFKADSLVYVHATAYLKGRILQVHLDGYDAREKKDQVIALLKSAASRL
jgi:hypothetical protein